MFVCTLYVPWFDSFELKWKTVRTKQKINGFFCLVNACFNIMHLDHQSDWCDKTHTPYICSMQSKVKAIHKESKNLWWKTAATDIRMDKNNNKDHKNMENIMRQRINLINITEQIIVIIIVEQYYKCLYFIGTFFPLWISSLFFSVLLIFVKFSEKKRSFVTGNVCHICFFYYMSECTSNRLHTDRSSDAMCIFFGITLTRGDINKIMDVSLCECESQHQIKAFEKKNIVHWEKNLLIYFSAIAINMNSMWWWCLSKIEKGKQYMKNGSRYESVLALHLIVSTFYIICTQSFFFSLRNIYYSNLKQHSKAKYNDLRMEKLWVFFVVAI